MPGSGQVRRPADRRLPARAGRGVRARRPAGLPRAGALGRACADAEIAGLARAVADRYGGTMADVLRLAIPPRHAVESKRRRPPRRRLPPLRRRPPPTQGPGLWAAIRPGPPFLAALADGRSPRAVWSALPGPGLAGGDRAARSPRRSASGRGALIVVPDATDLALARGGAGRGHRGVGLRQPRRPARARRALPPLAVRCSAARSRSWRGPAPRCSRPVADLGLVVLWDEGDDLHAEPRAPYPHAQGRAAAARAPRRGGGADRRLREDRRGRPADRDRLGQAAGGRPADGARQRPGGQDRRR